ncbi:MAG: 50S ribosomal protein L22 [Acidimicrobiia bacterium]|nr:50S ribosomal protein L22 [Acidimicrobiia bacterium]MYC45567.1 50S ribosomal protein L22 [Acidimicrobiia bacterium]MYI19468.1 50S ribosomal protein L22 [Acidimicrobiia bacterium]
MATAVAAPAARASARYVRSSASKVRPVLDLIRGESCDRADEILQFSERRVAGTVARCLDSAIANAEHNSNLPAEELYVAACYADEGPTLKRWRPRARGRATPIMKRTCHITIVLARYSLEEREARAERGLAGGAAAEVRRRRVEASRAAAEQDDEDALSDVDEVVEADAAVEQDADAADDSDAGDRAEQDDASEPAEGDKEI